MNKRFVKIISLALALMMVLSVVPAAVMAKGIDAVSSMAGKMVSRTAPEVYPEQTLTGEAGGVGVTVEAPEGSLPKGTAMEVAGVEDMGAIQTAVNHTVGINGVVLTAVDITFMNGGREIQPNGDVIVTMSASALAGKTNLRVVHIKADEGSKAGSVEEVEGIVISGDKVIFAADSFSIYAVIGDGETGDRARLTVEFYNGSELIETAIVTKAGLSLIDQTIPDPTIEQDEDDHRVFCGWIIDKPDFTSADVKGDHTINYVRAAVADRLTDEFDPIVEGEVMRVYAMFFYYYVVSYIGENGDVVLYSEAVYSTDEGTDYTVQYAYPPIDPSQFRFVGWTTVGTGDTTVYENGDTYHVTQDVVFRAKVQRGYWLIFEENPAGDDEHKGATYNPPVFCENGVVASSMKPNPNPTLVGYTFGGWYRDAACTQAFNFSGTLSAHTTVYAKWTANTTATYTVLVWRQNIDCDGYDFAESIKVIAAPNSTINSIVVSGTAGQTGSYVTINGTALNSGDYAHFHYKERTGATTVDLKNRSVVNVYYDRDRYTLTFQVPNGRYTQISTPTANDTNADVWGYVSAGYAYDSDYNRYTWTAGYRKLYARYASSSSSSKSWFFKSDVDSEGYILWIPYTSDYYGNATNSGKYYEPSGWTTIKTLEKGYGQFIGDEFPIVGSNGVTYNEGQRWYPQNGSSAWQLPIVFIESMPAESINFHLNEVARPVKTMIYYVEALPNETGETLTYNGVKYVKYYTIRALYNGVSAEDYLDLIGFNKVAVTDTDLNSLSLYTPEGASGDQYYEWDTSNNASRV